MKLFIVARFLKKWTLPTALAAVFSLFIFCHTFAETTEALNLKVDFIFLGLHENSLFVRERIEAENTGQDAIKATGSRLRIALPRGISPADYQATLNIGQATESIHLIQAEHQRRAIRKRGADIAISAAVRDLEGGK